MGAMSFESTNNEISPEVLGNKFNSEDFSDFVADLRQRIKANPSIRFTIVADWVSAEKARSAKALLDQYASRLNIDSITIRATRQQYNEEINVFESGVKWQEL
ncbi:MAG TPA: hypothetical protein PKN73_00285 [Candidatus Paceibacterota bacterium]|jgi:hypothetical protein|nr:hypothetical protein [Candidatus Paceibacterota bacterium]HOH11117.1 hypothetical protein [Candidatus Paceibacterota bacterium]HOY11417.1 hypothetical protein [Candidatus Paceibacterota bacterium]HPB60671.1 hypothetical protein [Candidatus Paceibacterota bacterium]HPI24740.1 hypothetical protein [Candidatus Paceibacterota bacterium]